ncbi:hypothetical protein CLF_105279 [Clonorchis sinensis]|uniref:Uncharacterized protein n=1 Tax=Clonorchis sinensis TaxID=79923 RepID=G7YP66_CLOSI|nr:hypothetical protein CLF_105279 [Clonorchis sinensis]
MRPPGVKSSLPQNRSLYELVSENLQQAVLVLTEMSDELASKNTFTLLMITCKHLILGLISTPLQIGGLNSQARNPSIRAQDGKRSNCLPNSDASCDPSNLEKASITIDALASEIYQSLECRHQVLICNVPDCSLLELTKTAPRLHVTHLTPSARFDDSESKNRTCDSITKRGRTLTALPRTQTFAVEASYHDTFSHTNFLRSCSSPIVYTPNHTPKCTSHLLRSHIQLHLCDLYLYLVCALKRPSTPTKLREFLLTYTGPHSPQRVFGEKFGTVSSSSFTAFENDLNQYMKQNYAVFVRSSSNRSTNAVLRYE